MIVTGFENIEFFRDFRLYKSKNNHTVCRFIAQNTRSNAVPDYDVSNDLIGKSVQIYAVDDSSKKSSDNFIMSGKVKSVEFVSKYTEDLITVTILPNSVSLEEDEHTRIFQDTKKTLRDMFAEIENSIAGKFVYTDPDFGREEIKSVILQYRETNKAFIEKIANNLNVDVWYDDKSSDEFQIRIGKWRDGSPIELKCEEFKYFSKSYSENRITAKIAVTDYNKINYVDIGQRIKIDGDIYVIEEMKIYLSRQRFVYELIGNCEQGEFTDVPISMIYPTVTFCGKVVSQEDPENKGRVQVDFTAKGIESIVKDQAIWIDVDTFFDGVNGGGVFVPDVDDYVDVMFSQNHIFVLGVRRQEALAEKHQNVSEKCIVDAKGRKIVFEEDSLKLISENSLIQINEEVIKILQDDVVLQIEKGKVSGNVSKSQFEVNDDLSIHSNNVHFDTNQKLEFNTTQSTVLESKTINITAGGEVAISGKPVALNS